MESPCCEEAALTSPEAKGPKVPPSHPPRTPPPQKKPVEPPRPQPATKSADEMPVRSQLRMVVRNRRTAAHPFRADEWAPAKAVRQVLGTVRGWGYPDLDEDDLERVVRVLVTAAVEDGGKRLSVHLGDQDHKVLVAVLSHTTGAPDQAVLGTVATLATVDSVGTDTGEDGRRMWAVLDAEPRRRPVRGTAAVRGEAPS
ncbi:hypothetical protein SLAV_37050 [Streptomyces lavendulae subsp. lavendulae]|uniref:Uncharacterized protein n=2 Tax=Streptomyces lavendulae TaxID=1914 RepID=A0A2K8PU44_STRLA|nr:hypothetical protein SLAV_37050 [Streptomyces lavendulae subsp. lavendulae]QUQ58991.1 hypothetical protein SLLC_35210 [Streptomyces lavendulae subsp. lavendulae]